MAQNTSRRSRPRDTASSVPTDGASGLWARLLSLFVPPKTQQSTLEHVPGPLNEDTVKMVYDDVDKQLEAQDAQVTALDTKAGLVLASASLLTAAVTALQGVISQKPHLAQPAWYHGVEIAALLLYAAVVYAAYKGYAIRAYERSPNPNGIRKYLAENPDPVRWQIMVNRTQNFLHNEAALTNKVWWMQTSLRLLIAEAVCIAVLGGLQVFL